MNKFIKEDIAFLIDKMDLREFYNKKILITGASGFIARYFVYLFMELNRKRDAGCKVYALVRNRQKAESLFLEYETNEFFRLEIGEVEKSGSIAKEMNYIFHAASISSSQKFQTNPVEVAAANSVGTYELLNAVKKEKNIMGFIFFSSGAVYGDTGNVQHDVREDEFFPFNPLSAGSCYGESKRMGENFCYSFFQQYQIPVRILRIGHTYGPGIDLYDGHVYSDFVRNIIKNENIQVMGERENTRPFTYVRDTIAGILTAALYGEDAEAYNVCNREALISIGELAELLAYNIFADRGLRVEYKKAAVKYLCKRRNITVDTRKLEKLKWNPEVGIEEGFLRTIESFEYEKE